MSKYTSIVASGLAMVVGVLTVQSAAHAGVYSAAVLADNPLAFYRMNESSGTTAIDSSGNGYNASTPPNAGGYFGGVTLGNAGPQPISGFGGFESTNTDATFNGSTGYMDTGSAITGTLGSSYSYEIWFNKPGNDGASHYIAGRYAGPSSFLGDSIFAVNNLRFFDGSVAVAGGTTFAANVWHQAVLTRNGSTVKVYLDGALEISTTTSTANFGSSKEFILGRRPDPAFPFSTGLDELSIYNSTLSAAQVLAQYNAALPEPTSFAVLGAAAIGCLATSRRRTRSVA